MQKEPEYLVNNRIRIYNQAGDEILPEQVDWTTEEAVNYMFRQDPGDQNSLGSIRMNFNNPACGVSSRYAVQGPVRFRLPV